MKVILAFFTLAASALAVPLAERTTCSSNQVVVCSGNGDAGLISLGNIATGLLGESCSGGDVYCCSEDDVKQVGLLNLNLNAQCSLNDVL
ncbi:hypothetical protein N7493_001739 [Penicillium malachiteum]|uniref:Hydrophobin n=1 Tax=Penicillium malachiteum TaxID=1324776 RepID=A0AAD6HUP7_9EURO|nr:hypothetical protein N7493_001739 [Penicillium malachiteum]